MEEDDCFETTVQNSIEENDNSPSGSHTNNLHLATQRNFSFEQNSVPNFSVRNRTNISNTSLPIQRTTPLVVSNNASRTHSPVAPRSTSNPILSLYARHTPNDTVTPAAVLPSISSHSIVFLREPLTFSEQDSDHAFNIFTSDLSVTQENREDSRALPQNQVVNQQDGNVNEFLQFRSPSLPVEGIWRDSSVLLDQMGIARRYFTPSIPVELVDHVCWLAPRLSAYCHLRHSSAGVNDPEPWIYMEHERNELNRLFSESSSESTMLEDDESDFTSRATVDTEDDLDDEPYEEFMLQPIPSLALDYVNPDTVSPEHPFPTPTSGRTPALHAVMAYINQTNLLSTQAVDDDNVDLSNYILASTMNSSPSVERRPGFIISNTTSSITGREEYSMTQLRLALWDHTNFYHVSPPVANSQDYLELVTDESDENVRIQSNVLLLPSVDEMAGVAGWVCDYDATESELSTSSSGVGSSGSSIIAVSSSTTTSSSSNSTVINTHYDDHTDTGHGDTNILLTSSSSHTSLGSGSEGPHIPVDWLLPSTTTISGSYDFLRVTDRPRPFAGHKFVISMFGMTARQNAASRLPWISTYAERLQMVLNQYLQQDGILQIPQSTQTEEQFSISELILTNNGNDTNNKEDKCCNAKTNNGTQCSSMAVESRAAVNKASSLRAASIQNGQRRRCDCQNDDIFNSNSLTTSHNFDNSTAVKTQSCPGIVANLKDADEKSPNPAITVGSYETAMIVHSSVESPEQSETTRQENSDHRTLDMKRRKMTNLFLRICCCQNNNSDMDSRVDTTQTDNNE